MAWRVTRASCSSESRDNSHAPRSSVIILGPYFTGAGKRQGVTVETTPQEGQITGPYPHPGAERGEGCDRSMGDYSALAVALASGDRDGGETVRASISSWLS